MLLKLKTYCYDVNLELVGKFISAFKGNDYELMEKYTPHLLASIKTGSINPCIVDNDIVKLWEARAIEELKWGRDNNYNKINW